MRRRQRMRGACGGASGADGGVPPSLDRQTVLPERVEKITYRQENNVLYLYTDANYAMMGAVRRSSAGRPLRRR